MRQLKLKKASRLRKTRGQHDLPISCDISTLTKSEMRLLYVMCDPDSADFNVKQLTDQAKVCRETYYRAIAKLPFVEAQKQIALAIVNQNLIALINVGVRNAKKGSFQHWNKLMEMGGMSQAIGEGANGEITIRFADPRAKPSAIDISGTVVPIQN